MNTVGSQNESDGASMDTNNVESIGHLSARCNAPLTHVLRAIDTLGIRPALVVDDVAHLSEHDAQRVAEALGSQRDRLQAKARKAGQ